MPGLMGLDSSRRLEFDLPSNAHGALRGSLEMFAVVEQLAQRLRVILRSFMRRSGFPLAWSQV